MAMTNTAMKEQLSSALSTIEDVIGNLRRLQTTECTDGKIDLDDPHNIAQIIQGQLVGCFWPFVCPYCTVLWAPVF